MTISDHEEDQRLEKIADATAQQLPPENNRVLDYQRPQLRRRVSRGRSVAKGIGWVWASLATAIVLGLIGRGSGFGVFTLVMLIGVTAGFIFATLDASEHEHAGFFLGLFVGVLTVVGVAGLTLAVVCGGFRSATEQRRSS